MMIAMAGFATNGMHSLPSATDDSRRSASSAHWALRFLPWNRRPGALEPARAFRNRLCTASRFEVIRDVVKLYARYGASDIADALNAIRSGDAFSNLINVIEEVAPQRSKAVAKGGARSSGAQKPKRVSLSSKEPLDRLIDMISQSNEPEYRRLANVLGAARKGEILPSSVEVRRLMTTLGIPIRASKDRLSLLRDVGEHLAKLAPADLTPLLRKIEQAMRQDSSLQGWTNIILRREQ
jgi:hypothetical protein